MENKETYLETEKDLSNSEMWLNAARSNTCIKVKMKIGVSKLKYLVVDKLVAKYAIEKNKKEMEYYFMDMVEVVPHRSKKLDDKDQEMFKYDEEKEKKKLRKLSIHIYYDHIRWNKLFN